MNKLKVTAYMFLLWSVCMFSGCGSKSRMYLQLEAKEQDTQADADGGQEALQDTWTDCQAAEGPRDTCFVYICGAVKHPGVFEVPAGSRIYEIITLAGGLKKNASVKGLNQAQQVADGDMIEILSRKEQREAEKKDFDDNCIENESSLKIPSGSPNPDTAHESRIDINTASAAELMTLNGIGEAKAASIISYREEHGAFMSIEEIMNVSGIGEGVYAQIKDKITVTG